MDGKLPILETVKFGWRHFRATLAAGAIVAALVAIPAGLIDWAAARANAAGQGLLGLLWFIPALFIDIPVVAAHYRQVLRGGPVRVAVGRDEALLAGVTAVLLFFFLIVGVIGLFLPSILAGVVLGAVGVAPPAPGATPQDLIASLGPAGASALLLVMAPLLLALIWLGARLILARPASLAEGRVLAFETWAWTKGNALRIVGAVLLLGLPLTLAALAAGELVASLLLGQGEARETAVVGYQGAAALILGNFLQLWLVAGPLAAQAAYFYRGLRPGGHAPLSKV